MKNPSENLITLRGENGYLLQLGDFSQTYSDWVGFRFLLKSDWYQASSNAEVSIMSLMDFSNSLGSFSTERHVELASEYGAFDLSLKLGLTGQVDVRGFVSNHLNSDNQIQYSFLSYLSDIDTFSAQLQKLLSEIT